MTSETKTIYQKLLSVQSEIGVVAKKLENPYFKSKYTDINALLEIIKPILNKHGLILTQPIVVEDGKNILCTTLIEVETGNEYSGAMILPENPDPQKTGAIISYFRRYGIVSLLAIQAEDTDGNDTAAKPTIAETTTAKPVASSSEVPTCECGQLMKRTKPGSKTPFYCRHKNGEWGKARPFTKQPTPEEQEFLDELGIEVE